VNLITGVVTKNEIARSMEILRGIPLLG